LSAGSEAERKVQLERFYKLVVAYLVEISARNVPYFVTFLLYFRGAFSIVKEAVHRETKERYAIKFVSKQFVSEKELKLLEREMEIMRKLEHKNIVQLIEVGETKEQIFIVMELYVLWKYSIETYYTLEWTVANYLIIL
jgi:hypothetical protein